MTLLYCLAASLLVALPVTFFYTEAIAAGSLAAGGFGLLDLLIIWGASAGSALASLFARDRLPLRLPSLRRAAAGSEEGTVKWFNPNKGFGFIVRDSGGEVFVHYRSIQGSGRRVLNEGQRVRFQLADTERGVQADRVEILA